MWRYAFVPQEEIDEIILPKEEGNLPEENIVSKENVVKAEISDDSNVPKAWEIKKEEIRQAKEKSRKQKNIDKGTIKPMVPKTFLEEIKQFLKNQNITIVYT